MDVLWRYLHDSLERGIIFPSNPILGLEILMYIDPNTGGMLFQVLVAALAVITGIFLIFSSKIRAGFARLRRMLSHRGEEPAEDEAAK